MSKKTVKFQEQYDTANTAMKNMSLSNKIQDDVRQFLINTQATQEQQEELKDFLANISPSLRNKVLEHIFSGVFGISHIFKSLFKTYEGEEEYITKLMVRNLEIKLTIPETQIIKQGAEPGGKILFLSVQIQHNIS
mgnify:CR=1 FL=1